MLSEIDCTKQPTFQHDYSWTAKSDCSHQLHHLTDCHRELEGRNPYHQSVTAEGIWSTYETLTLIKRWLADLYIPGGSPSTSQCNPPWHSRLSLVEPWQRRTWKSVRQWHTFNALQLSHLALSYVQEILWIFVLHWTISWRKKSLFILTSHRLRHSWTRKAAPPKIRGNVSWQSTYSRKEGLSQIEWTSARWRAVGPSIPVINFHCTLHQHFQVRREKSWDV